MLDAHHVAELGKDLVVGKPITELPGGRPMNLARHDGAQSAQVRDELLQRPPRRMSQCFQVGPELVARQPLLEAIDLLVPTPGQEVVHRIDDDRDPNQDRGCDSGQRDLFLVDHTSMLRRGQEPQRPNVGTRLASAPASGHVA
jgi:hypothetical protein